MNSQSDNCCGTPKLSLHNLDVILDQLSCYAHKHSLETLTLETIKLGEGLNRVLAEDVISMIEVPPSDNSAVDGYALYIPPHKAPVDIHGQSYPISQYIPAGGVPTPLAIGSAARIFTGASIPENANCVIMQEQSRINEKEGSVSFETHAEALQNIRPKGQDIQSGQTILKKGQRLTPQRLGLIASIGLSQISVYKPLCVAILSTGDELVEPGESIREGQIYNSNRYMLAGLLKGLNLEVFDLGVIPDNLSATQEALTTACKNADIVITTGGASVGEKDHIQEAIKSLGTIDFWRVAIKPGKPFMFGQIQNTPILGLPGNPGAVLVTFLVLARPFLLTTQGMKESQPKTFSLPLSFDVKKECPRREFLRVQQDHQGALILHPNQSSGMLSSASWAEGLAVIHEYTCPKKGEHVDFIPFSSLLSLPY